MNKVTILTVIAFIMLQSCGNNKHSNRIEVNHTILENAKFEVVIIDSCEYILYDKPLNQQFGIVHKGNCKFCAKRAKDSNIH